MANERDKNRYWKHCGVTFPARSLNDWKRLDAGSLTVQFIACRFTTKSSPRESPRAIMMLLSGGALRAEKVRKPKGRLGTSRSLSSPYTSCSHNALAAVPNHIPNFLLHRPRGEKGELAVVLNFKSQPASIIWHHHSVITGRTRVDCVNTSAELPPESSMQRIFPKSHRLGAAALRKERIPISSLLSLIPTKRLLTDYSRSPLWWNNPSDVYSQHIAREMFIVLPGSHHAIEILLQIAVTLCQRQFMLQLQLCHSRVGLVSEIIYGTDFNERLTQTTSLPIVGLRSFMTNWKMIY